MAMKKKEMINSIEYWIRMITSDSKEKYDKDFILVLLHKWLGREYTKAFEGYMSIGRIIELFEAEYKIVFRDPNTHINKRCLYVTDISEWLPDIKINETESTIFFIPEFKLRIIEVRRKTDNLSSKCFNLITKILKVIKKERMPEHIDKFCEEFSGIVKELDKGLKRKGVSKIE